LRNCATTITTGIIAGIVPDSEINNAIPRVWRGERSMAMVVIHRARLLALCVLLSLLPLGGTLADPAIKPAIVGLISTGSVNNKQQPNKPTPFDLVMAPLEQSGYGGIFGGVVVAVTWNQLQPTNSPIDTTVIDNALTAVAQYNATNNRQLRVRLRVFAGCNQGLSDAPTWAMSPANGGSITMHGWYNDKFETCTTGRFWDTTSGYATAWQQLQTQLANRYDSNPLIQEVAVTSCTSFSAEPFFISYEPNKKHPEKMPDAPMVLLGANFSVPAYQQCLQNAVADYAAWQSTRLEFTFNPFDGVLSDSGDVAFSDQVMRACRLAVGQRCILSNHDLDASTPTSILPLYAPLRKFGPNITFQSLHTNPPDLEGTIRKGISLGAGSIEVWPAGFKSLPSTTLQSWAAMFVPQ
jgi:hypothetical protein